MRNHILAPRNVNFLRSWKFLNADGEPKDVNTGSLLFSVFSTSALSTELLTITSISGLSFDADTGIIDCNISAAAFNLPCGDYEFVCTSATNDGIVHLIERGQLTITNLPEVSS